MTNQKRVLCRIGARELTPVELEHVSGGITTSLCTFNPKACTYDGDCTPLPRCP